MNWRMYIRFLIITWAALLIIQYVPWWVVTVAAGLYLLFELFFRLYLSAVKKAVGKVLTANENKPYVVPDVVKENLIVDERV